MLRAVLATLVAALLVGVAAPQPVGAAEPLIGAVVSPAAIPAPHDFSATKRGYFWDFSSERSYGAADSRRDWSDQRIEDGWLVGTTTRSTASIRLSQLTIPGTVAVPDEHVDTPIHPSFRYVSVRMCASHNTRAYVYWHRDAALGAGWFGATHSIPVRPGCAMYAFDLEVDQNPALGRLEWGDGTITGLRLRPATKPGVEIAVDFVTLSREPYGAPVNIRWDRSAGPKDLSFAGSDGRLTPIATGVDGGMFRWATPNLAPGRYEIFAGGDPIGRFSVVPPERSTIHAPSIAAATDYAVNVRGDAWDMEQRSDVAGVRNLAGWVIRNGRLVGSNVEGSGDPGIELALAKPVDSRRYRFLSYRLVIPGVDRTTPEYGGVSRVYFWNDHGHVSGTQDIRVLGGWRDVVIDLADAPLEIRGAGPWGTSDVTRLRFDPHESKISRTFRIDHVALLAPDVAETSYRIRYHRPAGTTVQLFWDDDLTRPGRRPITCRPEAMRPLSEIEACTWDLDGVPNGDAWVVVVTADRFGVPTTSVSELPILVQR